MTPSRREILVGAAALSGCGCGSPRPDGGDVFAAGQPAAILIFTLAPGRLAGWPRRPSPAALRLLPPAANLPELGALTGGGAPASLEAVAATRPALILDYGDTGGGYAQTARRLQGRVGAPYRIFDGRLFETPLVLTEAATLLDVRPRGLRLAEEATAILSSWSRPPGTGPSFYYARGRDGLETGFAGSLATEVLEGAGWRNVATGRANIGRVSREQVVAWDPDVVVTLDPAFARAAAADALWRQRRAGAARRLLLVPDLPFGWMDRPPSINRLLGCAWLGGGDQNAARTADRFSALFYGAQPATAAVPRWVA